MKVWSIKPSEWMLLENWERAAIIAFERESQNLDACIIEDRREGSERK